MSRDQVAKLTCYMFGVFPIVGLAYFAFLPKPAPHDFRAQMTLSRFAFSMAGISALVFFCGFLRWEREIKILTLIYGAAMCFLWLIIAAAHLPVA